MFKRIELFMIFVAIGLLVDQVWQFTGWGHMSSWALTVGLWIFVVLGNWEDESQWP